MIGKMLMTDFIDQTLQKDTQIVKDIKKYDLAGQSWRKKMINLEDELNISLVPRNEAEYPEMVKVQIKQKIPIEHRDVFIAKLLVQTKQDFGYHLGELLVVEVSCEDDKIFAYSDRSIKNTL